MKLTLEALEEMTDVVPVDEGREAIVEFTDLQHHRERGSLVSSWKNRGCTGT